MVINLYNGLKGDISMEKFIPFEKMSKKKQKEINQKKRTSWNGLNPVTKKSKNLKAYNRKRVLKWNDDSFQDLFDFGCAEKLHT